MLFSIAYENKLKTTYGHIISYFYMFPKYLHKCIFLSPGMIFQIPPPYIKPQVRYEQSILSKRMSSLCSVKHVITIKDHPQLTTTTI